MFSFVSGYSIGSEIFSTKEKFEPQHTCIHAVSEGSTVTQPSLNIDIFAKSKILPVTTTLSGSNVHTAVPDFALYSC